jgi:hypothetical protein
VTSRVAGTVGPSQATLGHRAQRWWAPLVFTMDKPTLAAERPDRPCSLRCLGSAGPDVLADGTKGR